MARFGGRDTLPAVPLPVRVCELHLAFPHCLLLLCPSALKQQHKGLTLLVPSYHKQNT